MKKTATAIDDVTALAIPPKPRGRPREFDREAALDAAMQVFWEKGFEAASINDLTTAMNVNPPSLYAAFGDKETLFLATIEHYAKSRGDQSHGRGLPLSGWRGLNGFTAQPICSPSTRASSIASSTASSL